MGCCASQEDAELKQKSHEIEEQLKKDKIQARNEVKMLLLGAGESGKSTILKQMKLIHDGGYNDDEREAFREVIYSNAVQSLRAILEAMETLGITYSDANDVHVKVIMDQPQQIETPVLDAQIVTATTALWQDQGVQDAYERKREYQLNDSARYYFENIERIGDAEYVPTNEDILRSRVKTTGITETTFLIGELTYKLLDVGGQRSERKKWIHCFEGVTAIVFMVAISEYDQVLAEDETVNRMEEALTLFESICNSRWFQTTSMILFLNKIDLFREKLPKSPIVDYFDDYEGDADYEKACDFFLNKFVSLNKNEAKQIYTHFTCATDTSQIKFVMAAVNDIIIQTNLRDCGLL
jgi:guanine nucleotide-binding protein subunit alpha